MLQEKPQPRRRSSWPGFIISCLIRGFQWNDLILTVTTTTIIKSPSSSSSSSSRLNNQVTDIYWCSWSNRLQPKKLEAGVAVPPDHVRILTNNNLSRMSRQSNLLIDDKVVNGAKPRSLHSYPYGWRKHKKISSRRQSECFAIRYRFKCSSLSILRMASAGSHIRLRQAQKEKVRVKEWRISRQQPGMVLDFPQFSPISCEHLSSLNLYPPQLSAEIYISSVVSTLAALSSGFL